VGVDRLGVRIAGDVAAVEAEGRHRGLADDLGAGVEEPRDDGRVLARDEPLEHLRAVEHRDAREADVVLDGDAHARQRALGRAGDGAFPRPAVARVLLAERTMAGVDARVLDRARWRVELVDAGVAGDQAAGQRRVVLELELRERHAERLGDPREID
jgi:hypothetical protein